jgi:hypothetical protein
MAKVRQCNVWQNAKKHKLASNEPAYRFQVVYDLGKCKGHKEEKLDNGTIRVTLCTESHMQWQGEYESGTFTPFYDIEPAKFEYWTKRIKTDEAKPEAQIMSEYSERIAKPPEQALSYLGTLKNALKWDKGKYLTG